ncbi:CynX/NimT family MFS transporter [Psychrobium sp. nBUS_13]|uniref:MFS transporter n=1 Tax=Psychrobium sp. nBUS_13 TaxID=3395319 RepID=UPI003EBEEA02
MTSIAPVMESIVQDLSISRASAGLITTIPVLLMGLLAPLAPILVRRLSQDFVLTATMAILSFAFALRYFSQSSLPLLLTSAFIAGSGIAIAGPLMSGFIKQYFANKMGVAVTIYSVSISIGASLAVALTIPIIKINGGQWGVGLASWGVLSIMAVLVLLIFLPTSLKKPLSLASHQKLPLRSLKAWLLTLFFAAQAGIFYALSTWIVAHYEQVGFSLIKASMLASVFMGSGIIGALVIPLLSSQISERRKLIVAVTLTSTLLLLCVAWAPQWKPTIVLCFLGVTSSGTFALALSLPVLESDSPQSASQLSSMMSFFGYILGGIAPLLIGTGRDITGSFYWPFTFLSVLSLSMVIIAIFLPNAEATAKYSD